MKLSSSLVAVLVVGASTIKGVVGEIDLADKFYCWSDDTCTELIEVPPDDFISLSDCICMAGFSFSASLNPLPEECVKMTIVVARRKLEETPSRQLFLYDPAGEIEECPPYAPPGCEPFFYTPDCGGGDAGDPHIKQLVGGWYDYHGECDMVLLHAPQFGDGIGLDVHVRSKARYSYSYLESAAVKIGDSILEVSSFGQYFVDGISGAQLPATLSGYPVTHTQTDKKHMFEVDIGNGNAILIDTMKDIVSVKVKSGGVYGPEMHSWFGNSTGLMGSLSSSKMIGRDGSVIDDVNAMGQEWQVLDSEPKLFQVQDRPPQYPEKCKLPTPAAKDSRRLGENMVSPEEAEKACEHWPEQERKGCIYDVLATADLELAQAGSY